MTFAASYFSALIVTVSSFNKFLLFKKCTNYLHYFCVTMCEIYVLNFECWPERLAQFTVLEQNTRFCTYLLDTSGQCSIYMSSTLFAMFEWAN